MDQLATFEMTGTRAFYRPVGCVSFENAVSMVTQAILLANARDADDLLVNVFALNGFDPPSLAERFAMASEWAAAADRRLRFAMVAPPELIDPHKFGVTVARNRGLDVDVFTSEGDALAWLDRAS